MSLTAERMEQAEARCLELVNDGPTHTEYSELFEDAVNKHGVPKLREAAAKCKTAQWVTSYEFPKARQWADFRAKRRFDYYNGRDYGTSFSRVVFGLVLEHWLSSNHSLELQMMEESVPYTPKSGDYVRLLVGRSMGGNDRFKLGTLHTLSNITTYDGIPCVVIGGNCYRFTDVELVKDDPAPPSHLDRAIAEQKSYYSPITKETVMLKIETKTYVDGREIAKLSVDDLVAIIAQAEAEIDKLKKLASKPKKVLAKIDELEAGLATLVKIADEA